VRYDVIGSALTAVAFVCAGVPFTLTLAISLHLLEVRRVEFLVCDLRTSKHVSDKVQDVNDFAQERFAMKELR
jgi:hypothetical protein